MEDVVEKVEVVRDETYGGFWLRFIAYLIDGVIIGIPSTIIMFSVGAFSIGAMFSESPGAFVAGSAVYYVGMLGLMVGTIAYYIGMECSKYQGTVGKKLLGLKVVDEEGKQITLGKSTIRYFSKILSSILYIGYIMIGITEKKQGLHDMIARTYVVRRDN